MEFDKDWASRILEQFFVTGRDDEIIRMYHYFSGMTGHNFRSGDILGELLSAELSGGFDSKTCKDFSDWFGKIDSCGDYYEEFKTLANSDQFMLLSYCLYIDAFRPTFDRNQISVRSSDGAVSKMDKRVAAAESEVLESFVSRDILEGLVTRGGEIPLDFPSSVLSEISHFVMKKHDFSQALKDLLGHYKGWFTGFLKRNRAILSHLHRAADFLSIKSLFDLTGQAVGDLMGRTLEEVSEWCGRLSTSQMLSSLVVGVGEDVGHHGGPSLLREKPVSSLLKGNRAVHDSKF